MIPPPKKINLISLPPAPQLAHVPSDMRERVLSMPEKARQIVIAADRRALEHAVFVVYGSAYKGHDGTGVNG